MLCLICNQESLYLWVKHDLPFHWSVWNKTLTKSFTPFLIQIVDKITFQDGTVDKILMLDEDSAESLLSAAIIQDLNASSKWEKEMEKLNKIQLGLKTYITVPIYQNCYLSHLDFVVSLFVCF